jgi:hypothetical protein
MGRTHYFSGLFNRTAPMDKKTILAAIFYVDHRVEVPYSTSKNSDHLPTVPIHNHQTVRADYAP